MAGARRAPMQRPEGSLCRPKSCRQVWAQSLGRHVVTIPSLRQTPGQMFLRTNVPLDKCSPGQFPRTKMPGHVSPGHMFPGQLGLHRFKCFPGGFTDISEQISKNINLLIKT